jgi:O-antigen/teichoic acid export membrane protein
MPSENNKRIAKNTLFLYFRTMLTMIVSLYTSRVILNTLGIVDYGLNNVVAGVITLFSFLNGALGASTSRFLTFELGRNDTEKLKNVFRTAFNIHAALAVIIVIFCETAGLWIVNHVLVIPPERLFACNIIYQYVVVSALLSITQVPLNASIIAHERMNVYAYLGISDAVLKLAVAYLITVSTFDKLITLGALNLCVSFGMYLFYHIYCKKHFSEYNFRLKTDKKLNREMIGFSTWSLLGQLQVMLKNQGINILINIFFGPAVNAANAIAYQVNHAITNFSNNFTTAMQPQIIKSYAANEREQMKALVFRAGKFSFFLLMILSIPACLEIDIILKLWLKNVPEYASVLTRLIIILTLIDAYTFSTYTPVYAVGKLKNYQLTLTCIYLLNLPLAYVCYMFGASPSAALIISIILNIICMPARLYFLKKSVNIGIIEYFKNVILINVFVLVPSTILPIFVYLYLPYGFGRLLLVSITSVISSVIFIYLLGLKKNERQITIRLLKDKLNLLKKVN